MEPLKLELRGDLARDVERSPLAVRGRIDDLQQSLARQIASYHREKQAELEAYAREQLAEHAASPPAARDPAPKERTLKSIVKRRPSSSDKRVSFLSSPTHVAIVRSEGSTDTETTDEELVSPDDPADFTAPAGLDAHDDARDAAHDDAPPAPRPYELTMPALDLSALQKKGTGQFLDDGTPVADHGSGGEPPVPLDHADLFSFGRDASEPPALETSVSDMAQSHHAPLARPTPDDSDGAAPAAAPPAQKSQFTVGSAPISIHSAHTHGLDGDGGPLPSSEAEVEQEQSLTQSSLPRSRIDELDPASMSFSQRMEWETLRRRNGS